MAITVLAVVVVGALFANFVVTTITAYWRLRDIPGPFFAAFSNLWFQLTLRSPVAFGDISQDLHKKYGSVVRIGPHRVLFGDAEAIPVIYGVKRLFRKSSAYKPSVVFANGREVVTLIGTLDETRVTALKKGMNAAFTPTSVIRYETHIDHTMTELIDYITSQISNVNLAQLLQYFAFDTICRIAFSEDQRLLMHQKDIGNGLAGAHQRFAHWNNWWAFPELESFLYKNRLAQRLIKPSLLARMAVEKIQTRLAKGDTDSSNDMLGRFLQAGQERPDIFAPDAILGLTISTIHAGAETTANSMSGVFYQLLHNPKVLAKLLAEFKEADLQVPVRLTDVEKLPYLEACIMESMRLLPLTSIPIEREVPRGGAEICGRFVPGGTIVAVTNAAVTHQASIYGADHEVYRPERWLEASEEQLNVMRKADLSFASGKRSCPGIYIAWAEMRKTITELLLTFDIEIGEPGYKLKRGTGMVANIEYLPVKMTRRAAQ